jgi:hypothetical protein
MAEGNETAPIVFYQTASLYQENQAIGAELSFLAMRLLIKLAVSLLDFNLNPEVSYYGGQMKRIIQEF